MVAVEFFLDTNLGLAHPLISLLTVIVHHALAFVARD